MMIPTGNADAPFDPVNVEAFRAFALAVGESLRYFGPEIVLTITCCALFLLDLFIPKERTRSTGFLAFFGCLTALVLVFPIFGETRALFPTHDLAGKLTGSMLAIDPYSNFFKSIFLIGTLAVIVMSFQYTGFGPRRMGEYYGLLVASVLGMNLMAMSTNLLMMFLSIELVSLASYVLVGYLKDSRASSEAALKYVIYGSVAAALMLYGISLLYGLAGTGNLSDVTQLLCSSVDRKAIALAFFLTFAGFAYKIAAFPMQFWTPDVYEGAPTPITAFLAVTSKAAGFAVFVRFMDTIAFGDGFRTTRAGFVETVSLDWPLIIGVIAALTMTFGNLAALFQKNVKRLLAYSSISHAGYALMGVAALHATPTQGFQALVFYLFVYLFMNLGAFAVVVILHRLVGTEEISGFRGLGRRSPLLAALMTVFLISLIGLPPTAGFSGKLQLFMAAVSQDLIWLAVAGAVNTAISVYYYARIIKAMYLEPADRETPLLVPSGGLLLTVVLAVPVLYLGIFFGGVLGATQQLVLFSALRH